tara:strand:- start:45 stop:623 length:579 start_codon:yes stop_codon:yes gene_type:complete
MPDYNKNFWGYTPEEIKKKSNPLVGVLTVITSGLIFYAVSENELTLFFIPLGFIYVFWGYKKGKKIIEQIEKEEQEIKDTEERERARKIKERERERILREEETNERKKSLIEKYGEDIAQKIIKKELFIDMTKEMLVDALGYPSNEKETVTREKTTKKYYYHPRRTQQNTTVYGLEVTLEDNVVGGWKDLEL